MRTLTGRQIRTDVVVAVAFALCGVVWIAYFGGSSGLGRVDLVPLGFLSGALAFRRLSPGVALAIAWFAAVVQVGTRLQPGFADLAICAVLYATAAYGSRIVRWLGLASAIAGSFVVTVYLVWYLGWFGGVYYLPTLFEGQLRDFVILFVGSMALLVLSWVSGLLMRSRRQGRVAVEREESARHDAEIAEYRVVVEQERNRIARDMHDVVAHTLAVVIAQADGARFAASARPDLAVDALGTIAGVARDALGDVRMLLAELRHDEGSAPQPGLADFDGLMGQLRAAGLDLTVREEGERVALGAARELAAFRIVQEGLTNALRHGAAGAPVQLSLIWAADALHIELVNLLPAEPPTATGASPAVPGPAEAEEPMGPGHGLPGMQERAQLAGGSLVARPDGRGRFVVRVWIPNGASV